MTAHDSIHLLSLSLVHFSEGETESVFGTTNVGQKVSGVVVVAEGAGSASVNARISDAVKALFSIDVHKISIVKMRAQEGQR